MSFGSPLALLALLAIPAFLGAVAVLARRRPRNPVVFTNLGVLETVIGSSRRRRRRLVPAALLLLALALAATAAAHPQARVPVRVDNATIVLLVDVSGSMSARDVEPTRLDAAVAAMRSFVQNLPKGFKVGLVQFSDSPAVLAVPTADHARVAQTLDLLTPDSGTAIGAGLVSATRLVQSSLRQAGYIRVPGRRLPAAIVLLSDGNQTQGPILPLAAAQSARRAGIAVDTVALGTSHGILGYGPFARRVAPDPPLMAAISKATGGETATASNSDQLSGFYRGVGRSFGHATKTEDVASWFAAAAALLLASAILLGRRLTGPLAT
ncbi:MAG TPA: VWA domain-containing protein [Gaiellaceae bacterium]|jgi:Ca-activated chloride channel family protein|nr:VWA domain-containing protein [Gaiellaceae bacterium]